MTITATEFKAKCLELLTKVQLTGEVITITKRGKKVAQLVSITPEAARPGIAKGSLKIVGEIVEPFDAGWETE